MHLYINAKEDILWPGSDTTRKGEIYTNCSISTAGRQLRVECARQTRHSVLRAKLNSLFLAAAGSSTGTGGMYVGG